MTLYGALKYGAGVKYGNQTFLTNPDSAYLTAMESLVRAPYGLVYINSHYKQYGNLATYPTTLVVGGSNHKSQAQRFIAPKNFSCTGVQVMMKGAIGNTAVIDVRIETETSGAPSGTVVANASGSISAITDTTPQWYKVNFDSSASLTGGTAYWIIIYLGSSNTNTYYVAADDYDGINQSAATQSLAIYGIFKYGTGVKYGYSYTGWTSSTTYTLLTRLVSSASADNDVVIQEATGFRLTRDRESPAYSFALDIFNRSLKYSVGQPWNSFLTGGQQIQAYIGFSTTAGVKYYKIFMRITERTPMADVNITMSAKCFMAKLLNDFMSSQSEGSTAYETIIQHAATHAGISSFSLRTTGKTSPTTLAWQNIQSFSIADQVRQATVDRMQFKNGTTLITTARAKATVSESTVPAYSLTQSLHIKSMVLGNILEEMINRLTVTNDENGETTTDGKILNVGAYQTIGTASGTLAAGTQTTSVTITLTQYAAIYMDWSNAGSGSDITETSRSPGTYNTYGSVVLSIRNKNYPNSSATYNVTVKGCPISNAAANTVLVEQIDQSSQTTYGKFGKRIDNKVFANSTDAGAFATAALNEKSTPIILADADCRGIPHLYPDDVIRLTDTAKTKINHLCILRRVELDWGVRPVHFDMKLEAEKTAYYGS